MKNCLFQLIKKSGAKEPQVAKVFEPRGTLLGFSGVFEIWHLLKRTKKSNGVACCCSEGSRSTAGIMEYDSEEDSVEAVVLCNHEPLKSEGNISLLFAARDFLVVPFLSIAVS